MFELLISGALLFVIIFISFITINHCFTFLYLFLDYSVNSAKDPTTYPLVSSVYFTKQCFYEYIYNTAQLYLFPVKYMDLNKNVPLNNSVRCHVAILLIHGYSRDQIDWLWFAKKFADINCPIYTINLQPKFAAIQQITYNSLPDKIAQIKQQTNCERLILIGHSMGGLVATYYSEYLDNQNLVEKVITIASPFRGTTLSYAAIGSNAKQMRPNTVFAAELRNKVARSKRKYYQIATRFDNIVFPWQSELLDSVPEDRKMIVPLVSHLALLHSPEVVQQVKDWVRD